MASDAATSEAAVGLEESSEGDTEMAGGAEGSSLNCMNTCFLSRMSYKAKVASCSELTGHFSYRNRKANFSNVSLCATCSSMATHVVERREFIEDAK